MILRIVTEIMSALKTNWSLIQTWYAMDEAILGRDPITADKKNNQWWTFEDASVYCRRPEVKANLPDGQWVILCNCPDFVQGGLFYVVHKRPGGEINYIYATAVKGKAVMSNTGRHPQRGSRGNAPCVQMYSASCATARQTLRSE